MFSEEKYTKSIDMLREVVFSLDEHPTLERIIAQIAHLTESRTAIHLMLLEALENRNEAKLVSEEKEREYKSKREAVLTNDESIRSQKTVDLRESAANTKVAMDALAAYHAKVVSQKADNYFGLVQQTQRYLEDVQVNLNRQQEAKALGLTLSASLQ